MRSQHDGPRRGQSGTLVVKIATPVKTAVLATFGVFLALFGLIALVYVLDHPHIDSVKVRALCAHHRGVARLDEGVGFMDGTAFVTCRDGWYERADN